MEQIKTFEDACAKQGYDPATVLPDFSLFPEAHRPAMTAHAKLVIIAEALNDGWKPDWSNGKWDKFYPWFDMDADSAGSSFSFYVCDYDGSYSVVGSRLCYKSADLARYAGKQFEDLYRDYFVMQ